MRIVSNFFQVIRKIAAIGFMAGSLGVLSIILYRLLVLLGYHDLYKEIENDIGKQFVYYQSFAILLSFLLLPMIKRIVNLTKTRYYLSNKYGVITSFFLFLVLLDVTTWLILNYSNVPTNIKEELSFSTAFLWYKMMIICFFSASVILLMIRFLESTRLNISSRRIYNGLRSLNSPLYSLYLRPFDVDNKLTYATEEEGLPIYYPFASELIMRDFSLNIEKELAKTLQSYFPLIGLGKENLNVSGRIRTSNNDWQETFKKLAAKACYIFVIPAINQGTFFEVSWINDNKELLAKTIFIMPPARLSIYDENRWNKVVKKYVKLNLYFPSYSINGSLFKVASDGNAGEIFPLILGFSKLDLDKQSLMTLMNKNSQ